MSTKMVNAALQKDLQLSRKLARWVKKTALRGVEEGAIQDVLGVVAMIAAAPSPSWTTFPQLVSQPVVKSELAALTLNREAS